MRGLRRLRARVPGRGHLLRGRRPRAVEGLLQGERRFLPGTRLPRWRVQGRQGRQGPPTGRGTAAAGRGRVTLASRIPEYPWDELAPLAEKARAFPGGAVDLSLGSPVDPVPSVVKQALAAAADAPGYPRAAGTPEWRAAAVGWLARALDVHVPSAAVLPVVGTKEFIAWLPTQLGLGTGDTVIYPSLAYPTYAVGAQLAGASPVVGDAVGGDAAVGVAGDSACLLWINSPSNPTGRVLPREALRSAVGWTRERGCVLASDECYISLGW